MGSNLNFCFLEEQSCPFGRRSLSFLGEQMCSNFFFDHNFYIWILNWNISTYKIGILLETFPTIGHNNIWKQNCNDCDCKRFGTYVFLGNLGLSQEKVPFSLGNLGIFSKKIHYFLVKLLFFIKELFLLHGELAWDWYLIFFCLRKLFLKGNQLKNY